MMLSIRIKEKRFAARRILQDVTLQISTPEIVSIIGRSGIGKTTLLRIIAGLDTDVVGEIEISGQHSTQARERCGLVFQDSRLFPWLTVLDNIAFGVSPTIRDVRMRRDLARVAMASVELGDTGHFLPREISGGMARRVALAREIVGRPALLLLDEPFTGLDLWSRHRLQDLVRRVHAEFALPTILITHNLEEAVYLSDRIFILDDQARHRMLRVDLPHPRDRLDPTLAAHLNEVQRAVEANLPAPAHGGRDSGN